MKLNSLWFTSLFKVSKNTLLLADTICPDPKDVSVQYSNSGTWAKPSLIFFKSLFLAIIAWWYEVRAFLYSLSTWAKVKSICQRRREGGPVTKLISSGEK